MGTVQGHEPESGGLVGQINSGLDTGTFGNCSGRFPKMADGGESSGLPRRTAIAKIFTLKTRIEAIYL